MEGIREGKLKEEIGEKVKGIGDEIKGGFDKGVFNRDLEELERNLRSEKGLMENSKEI